MPLLTGAVLAAVALLTGRIVFVVDMALIQLWLARCPRLLQWLSTVLDKRYPWQSYLRGGFAAHVIQSYGQLHAAMTLKAYVFPVPGWSWSTIPWIRVSISSSTPDISFHESRICGSVSIPCKHMSFCRETVLSVEYRKHRNFRKQSLWTYGILFCVGMVLTCKHLYVYSGDRCMLNVRGILHQCQCMYFCIAFACL